MEHFDITNVEYSMIYSIYTIPNIVICFFAGPQIERHGIRKSGIVCAYVLLFGHVIFTVSTMVGGFTLALVGRLFIG